jgi:hypothetical protein
MRASFPGAALEAAGCRRSPPGRGWWWSRSASCARSGDPGAYFAGNAATREAIEQVGAKLGLDRACPSNSPSAA